MTDNAVVHIGENSPEEVAYKLMKDISSIERRPLHISEKLNSADRAWILDTYAECLEAVRGYRSN